MKEYDSLNPAWITSLDNAYFQNANFQKILSFFVIHTPVTSLSAQARDLHSYGWNSPWNKRYYLNKQLKHASTNHKLIYAAKTYADMTDALGKADLLTDFPNRINTERIAVHNGQGTQFTSIFYHIRNSIAHARFIIRDVEIDGVTVKMYVFQDGQKDKSTGMLTLAARMVLRESTLMRWIEIIEGGEVEYTVPEDND